MKKIKNRKRGRRNNGREKNNHNKETVNIKKKG